MRSNRQQSTTQPLMTTALLAVAFMAVSARERAINEQPGERFAQTNSINTPRLADQSLPWHQRLVQAIARQISRHFYCALPSGLEPKDFDLSDLSDG